ncbi:MAG: peptidylprolyl isomerase [Deltaproteobacteria bacterium]|nr:peptidylprolyl isomerase [Deltaproteobacteria bacterium]
MAIQNGSMVSLEYTLTLNDGTIIDSNVGGKPLNLLQGSGMIIPGLDRQILGMKAGDMKMITVSPEEGYGPVDPEEFQEVPRENVPKEAQAVNCMLQGETEDGRRVSLRVHEIRENTVIVDANHPLAGKTLNFEVKILSVK